MPLVSSSTLLARLEKILVVRMVTGDNLDTATAIAIEANILGSNFYST